MGFDVRLLSLFFPCVGIPHCDSEMRLVNDVPHLANLLRRQEIFLKPEKGISQTGLTIH